MSERVFTLPDVDFANFNRKPVLQAPFDIILKTMENWCDKDQDGDIKGLVIFGYSLDDHLKFLKYHEEILTNYLCNRAYPDSQETVTVYNPQKRVIFIFRRARDDKDLEHEMKSSTDDILKFVFLYNNILNNSGIKLINLLVVDADVHCGRWKCKFCKHQVISMNALKSSDLFQKWLEEKECSFETDYDPGNKSNTFSFDFSAKLLGFLASFQFSKENHFHWTLPSLTNNPARQMTETTILLTLEQLRIVNSPNKHLMIQGCYGSGKSIAALKKAEMTSKILKEKEILYFISYDSSSMLTADIESTSNMKLYRNEGALKLSKIINNIKTDHPECKINLIVDEYDGEQLDEPEATKLNHIFTTDENFRNSIICLVFEALERERLVNGIKQIANLLPLLKSMELKELTYNKRNTLQIFNIFYMVFKMMGVLEKVTNRYEEFKNVNSKKIFIASFRAFRGLEYPRVVVVLDRNVSGLEQYLPECLNRCTTYLHVILLKKDTCMLEQTLQEGTALQNIIAAWKMQYKNKKLINYWRVHIFGSHTDKARTKFYEKRDLGVIKINSTSRKYKELEANFGKLQCLKNENTNEEKIIQEEVESAVAR